MAMTTKYQPGTRVSEYVLEQCVGAGTFGEVWQARHHVWEHEHVAVKLPTEPEYVRFLQREGLVVHGLRHPNIIRVIGLDPFAEIPYLVMELVKGPSLRAVLADHAQGLPIETAILVLRGLLRAMEAAHAAHVIHRDLKPGNVLLDLDSRALEALTVDNVKVGDFGLGVTNADALRSVVEQSVSIERAAHGATIAGTLAYMAPEVRDGAQPPGARSDLYSIGVTLFEMLTGARPAGAELPGAVRSAVPPALDEVFRRLYTRYEARYASAAEVLAELNARLTDPRLPPRPPRPFGERAGPPPPPPPPGGAAGAQLLSKCPACERLVEADDQFCTHCGRQITTEVRRCGSCGAYPGPRDVFCIHCGVAVAARE